MYGGRLDRSVVVRFYERGIEWNGQKRWIFLSLCFLFFIFCFSFSFHAEVCFVCLFASFLSASAFTGEMAKNVWIEVAVWEREGGGSFRRASQFLCPFFVFSPPRKVSAEVMHNLELELALLAFAMSSRWPQYF